MSHGRWARSLSLTADPVSRMVPGILHVYISHVLRAGHAGRITAALVVIIGVTRTDAATDIPFKVIDGRLCAPCTLWGPAKSAQANVVIDLGSRMPLVVHSTTARSLRIPNANAGKIQFGDLVLDGLRVAASELRDLEDLTARRAAELGEAPAAAIIGLPAFARFNLELDVGSGVLRLLPVDEPLSLPADATTLSYEEAATGYFLPAVGPEDYKLRARFSTARHDTLIDSTTADLAGSAGGAIDELLVGPINLSKYVALRPEDLSASPEPRPDVVLGTNLLGHFRVWIDVQKQTMSFQETRPAKFPAEERVYFVARAAGDIDAIEDFLKSNPASRLAAEAGEQLLRLRLEESPANAEAIVRAVRRHGEGLLENRRAQLLTVLADTLLGGEREDRYQLAGEVLKVAMESAPADLNGKAAFHIQARHGLIALRQDDLQAARRGLLSAAFGLPRDPKVNLWLGELYERTGKLTRAWSRYVQAAIDREPPPEALIGLDRLNRDPEFRKDFSMVDAEQLLEGRISEFHPPARFSTDRAAERSTPVRLVELFTCINAPPTAAAELAFAGLREYFEDAPVAFIEYHLSSPAPDPLTSEAAQVRALHYNVSAVPVALFDGRNPNRTGGEGKDAARLMTAYRRSALAGESSTSPWRLTGQFAVSGEVLAGDITVLGAEASPPAASMPAAATSPAASEPDLRLHIILCERIVMAPGANQLALHRCVARALLSPVDGHRVVPRAVSQTFPVHAEKAGVEQAVESRLKTIEREAGTRFLIRATYVDLPACTIVAVLQDACHGGVVSAASFDLAAGGVALP